MSRELEGEIALTEAADIPAADTPQQSDSGAEPIFVPYTELSEGALRGVLESFVLREGTEYGEHDVSLDQKVSQVTKQLQRGEARIVFDPESETIDILVTTGNTGASNGRPPMARREKP